MRNLANSQGALTNYKAMGLPEEPGLNAFHWRKAVPAKAPLTSAEKNRQKARDRNRTVRALSAKQLADKVLASNSKHSFTIGTKPTEEDIAKTARLTGRTPHNGRNL